MPRQTLSPRARRLTSLLLSFIGILGCAPALSAPSPSAEAPRYVLNIPSLPLDAALQEFARQSGVQILFFSQITTGLHAPSLTGEHTLQAAMTNLLSGSGLSFRVINAQTVEVRQIPAESAGSGKSEQGAGSEPTETLEEVLVWGKAEQLVATRVPTPLHEIPQSISIISPEQIRQQNAADLGDAMRRATGIIIRRTNSHKENFYARGFQIHSVLVDGGAALSRSPEPFAMTGTPDLSEFDHIEVLRGSDALFSGNANPAGTVSLVRKRPLARYQAAVKASVGSWESGRFELDLTGPIARHGDLRGRLGAVYSRNDYFYDTSKAEHKQVFGAIEYGATPDITLTAGGSYQWDDAVPWFVGLPNYADGKDRRLPRNTALTFDWSFIRTQNREAYVQYRQQLRNNWSIKVNAAEWRSKVNYAYGWFSSFISAETQTLGPFLAFYSSRPIDQTQSTADLTLTGELGWFGMREEVAIGADVSRFKTRGTVALKFPIGPSLVDVRDFDQSNYPDPRSDSPRTAGSDFAYGVEQYGAFASIRVHMNDAWSATAGARVASDDLAVRQTNGDALEYGSSRVVTPFLGLMYRINEHYSWYASYAKAYLTNQPAERHAGGLIGPADGITAETGVKGVWRDGTIHGALALYRIKQTDLPLLDLEAPYDPSRPDCCALSETARSYGAELEVNGEPQAGWLIGAGYAYNHNEPPSYVTSALASPRHLAKVWTSLQLRGALARWNVGGNLEAQTDTTTRGLYVICGNNCVNHKLVQNGYAVVDLRTAFQLNPGWEISLSINNLFDKHYYESVGPFLWSSWYGPPRNFMLSLEGAF